jgi:hypothetical protein
MDLTPPSSPQTACRSNNRWRACRRCSKLHSASAIAEAAKQFGQQDDITVLSITLAPALKAALA